MAAIPYNFQNLNFFPVKTTLDGPTKLIFNAVPYQPGDRLTQVELIPGQYRMTFEGDNILARRDENLGNGTNFFVIPEGLRFINPLVRTGEPMSLGKTCEIINDKEASASLTFATEERSSSKTPALVVGPSQKVGLKLGSENKTFIVRLGDKAARVTAKDHGNYSKLYLSSVFPYPVPGRVEFFEDGLDSKELEELEVEEKLNKVKIIQNATEGGSYV